jgi:hypothetical protein
MSHCHDQRQSGEPSRTERVAPTPCGWAKRSGSQNGEIEWQNTYLDFSPSAPITGSACDFLTWSRRWGRRIGSVIGHAISEHHHSRHNSKRIVCTVVPGKPTIDTSSKRRGNASIKSFSPEEAKVEVRSGKALRRWLAPFPPARYYTLPELTADSVFRRFSVTPVHESEPLSSVCRKLDFVGEFWGLVRLLGKLEVAWGGYWMMAWVAEMFKHVCFS